MARGFRGSGGRSSGRSSTGRARSNSSKGRIGGGKTVQYSVKNSRGSTKYVGSTNNPRARAAQHRESGKMGAGDKLVVETRGISTSGNRRKGLKLPKLKPIGNSTEEILHITRQATDNFICRFNGF